MAIDDGLHRTRQPADPGSGLILVFSSVADVPLPVAPPHGADVANEELRMSSLHVDGMPIVAVRLLLPGTVGVRDREAGESTGTPGSPGGCGGMSRGVRRVGLGTARTLGSRGSITLSTHWSSWHQMGRDGAHVYPMCTRLAPPRSVGRTPFECERPRT